MTVHNRMKKNSYIKGLEKPFWSELSIETEIIDVQKFFLS